MKRRTVRQTISLLLALALSLCPVTARAEGTPQSQSGRVVAQALSQMGYTEGADEYTKFGQRYGYPHGFWCDMFVSWCAQEAGVPASIFPSNIACVDHTRAFKSMGRYQSSAARGGAYLPQQGDLVFFYRPATGVIHHVGLVLYTENGRLFTVEGNALTNRLDHPGEEVSPLRRNSKEPPDYVTVNIYSLKDPRLYGYAVPAYTSREPLALEGYVDLGPYSELQPQLTALAEAGIMAGTSSHTFSPRGGMERGEFIRSVAALCGLLGEGFAGTTPFADVPMESPYFEAVMAARAAGLIEGDDENRFRPDLYISGADAQAILSRAAALMGVEDQTFSFGPGDIAYIFESYTTRIDLAKALYALMGSALETEVFEGVVTLRGKPLDWPARTLRGSCYVPLTCVLERYPEIKTPGWTPPEKPEAPEDPVAPEDTKVPEGTEAPEDTKTPEGTEVPEDTKTPEGTEVPEGPAESGRSTGAAVSLDMEGRVITVNGFHHEGVLYVPLQAVADLLTVKLKAEPAA